MIKKMSKGKAGPQIELSGTTTTLTKAQLEAQIRKLRAKEYYTNRVKRDFAPDAESESDSYDDEEPNSAGSPTSFTKSLDKDEKKRKKKNSPKKAKEQQPWNELFWAEKSEKKKKYLK